MYGFFIMNFGLMNQFNMLMTRIWWNPLGRRTLWVLAKKMVSRIRGDAWFLKQLCKETHSNEFHTDQLHISLWLYSLSVQVHVHAFIRVCDRL